MKHVLALSMMFCTMALRAQDSLHHFDHTESTSAPSERIWNVWTDVANWHKWDKGLKHATLEGDFSLGARGVLIPDRGPRSKFVITELSPGSSYSFHTRIPFGWLIIKRTLSVGNGLTYFTHDVRFTGMLKNVIGRKLSKKYKVMLPDVMNEIKRIAESQ